MKRHRRALVESLFLHGALVAGVVLLAGAMTPPLKTIRLDFTLQQTLAPARTETSSPAAEASPALAASQPEARSLEKVPSQQLAQVTAKIKRAPAPIKSKPEQPARETEPESTGTAPVAPVSLSKASTSTENHQASEAPSTATDDAYTKANFTAIRDSILANLRYPNQARRRGWSGQVEVAFTITPNGGISNLKILTSSGFPLLDDQAMAAIERSAPFSPAPNIAANLVMPVTFRLN